MYDKERTFVRSIGSHYYNLKDEMKRLRSEPRVIKAKEFSFKGGPQMWSKHIVHPARNILQSLHLHVEELAPKGRSQKHGHQNEALMYILDGEGYEIHDGKKYRWEAGDLVVIHGGSVHQHFNANPKKPARALIIKAKPLYIFLNLMYQQTVELPPKKPIPGWEDYKPSEP